MGGEFTLRDVSTMDPAGGFERADVAVRDGIITAVGPNLPAGGGADHDLAGFWLMPGVFDCHAHMGWSTYDVGEALSTPITRWALEAAHNARRTLEAGVTFVRDAGGADAGIRDGIAAGFVPGPELQVSVVLLSQTGGHGDGFLAGPGHAITSQYLVPDYPGRPPYLVDGPDSMRAAVRETLRAGADWIKICTTGGVLSPHDEPLGPELTLEEISVAVAEAARKNKAVMAHCNGGEGLDLTIEAGVRSVEHGIFLTEAQAAAMARAGTWLVPTLLVLRDALAWADAGRLPAYAVPKAEHIRSAFGDAVRIAREHGVRIAMGTDALNREQHGRNLEEIALMCDCGMPIAEALVAATSAGAELCGVADRLGQLVPGRRFDAIVLDRDPTDPETFRTPGAVTGVFRAGEAVVPHAQLEAV